MPFSLTLLVIIVLIYIGGNCYIFFGVFSNKLNCLKRYSQGIFLSYNEAQAGKSTLITKRIEAVYTMDRERFNQLVARVVKDLPEEFLSRLQNVDVVVEDCPTPSQLSRAGLRYGQTLLGLYEGVPQTKRGSHYGLVTPDKITIFQKTIEARCRHDAEIIAEIQRVVKHEIAHHFGISDARLKQIEKAED